MIPRLLYFRQVPYYIVEKYRFIVDPQAAWAWSSPKRKIMLNHFRYKIPGGYARATTARDVDEFLRLTGKICPTQSLIPTETLPPSP